VKNNGANATPKQSATVITFRPYLWVIVRAFQRKRLSSSAIQPEFNLFFFRLDSIWNLETKNDTPQLRTEGNSGKQIGHGLHFCEFQTAQN
jgi:hypothetical protein